MFVNQLAENTGELLPQGVGGEVLPVVEIRRAAQTETSHEIVVVQQRGRMQIVDVVARRAVAKPLDVAAVLAVDEPDRSPIGGKCIADRGDRHRKGAAQGRPRALLVDVGPEHRGDPFAAVRVRLDSEHGQQGNCLAGVERQRLAVAGDDRRPEKFEFEHRATVSVASVTPAEQSAETVTLSERCRWHALCIGPSDRDGCDGGTVTNSTDVMPAELELRGDEAAAPKRRGLRRRPVAVPAEPVAPEPSIAPTLTDIAPNDPILSFFQGATGAVDITALALDSPALDRMRAAGVVLVVPLVASGELIGLLNLGARLSERGYSTDDRRLLDSLASYAAPAMRVGQLVQQQEVEARNRERMQQELKIAQLIQQQFLPKAVPDLPGWHLAAFYRPARTIGGDFYDFITLPDGRVMIVVGDVTDKGIPAALVMASTHALLRSDAPQLVSPGAVLARVNDLLCEDIPAHMFVTCLALVLDPTTGTIVFANAGHNLPYLRTANGVVELRATGMPLGLMQGMKYDEQTAVMRPGEGLLLHSDGLAEAHNSEREMFGFPRLSDLVARDIVGQELIDTCMAELGRFVGVGVEQEDDITLVTLNRRIGAVYAEESS